MLPAILHDIRAPRDLSRLFRALGYTSDDRPIGDGARVVAHYRGFRVVATDAADAPDGARRLARDLARHNQRALAAALARRVLALAAPRLGTEVPTRALVVSLDRPSRATLERLAELRPRPTDSALTHALRVAELFDAESTAERFFGAFRQILERMAGALDPHHPLEDRRMAALLSLTRILFLYFIQAKGWLDGRPDYLRSLFDDTLTRGRHFHRTALRPLFFGTLNRPAVARARRLPPGTLPYLNGGLFEPHAVERRLGSVAFGNALWRDAFDTVFERFRFCLREAVDADAVAPDMLGRVFERLMDGAERHDTGTFYTPVAVVHQLVDAAIETALAGAGGLSPGAARCIVAEVALEPAERRRARRALRGLRVLDPAAGSGAFLLGALDRLTAMRLALAGGGHPAVRWQTKRAVLRENLFGVDLNPVAVRLAELRLWLAVVADDPTTDIRTITPLPNLDGVVRQGDSLLDPLSAVALIAGGYVPQESLPAARAVRDARAALFDATGEERRRRLAALREAEGALARTAVEAGRRRAERELAELAAHTEGRDLFGRRRGTSGAERGRRRALAARLADLRDQLRELAAGRHPAFSFDVHAPEVIAAGGFTVVVGNPPWVRAERLAPARRRMLRDRFSWWRAQRVTGYGHQPDLAIAFLQRAFELTAPGGAVGLLLPSKVVTSGYGEAARAHLVRETTVTYLHRVPEREARAFGATTYPLALVAQRAPPPEGHVVRLEFGGDTTVPQAALAAPGPWILVPDRIRRALEAFAAAGPPLDALAPIVLGVKTGADGVFVGTEVERRARASRVRFGDGEAWIEREVLRPALRGRDVAAFAARATRVILWGCNRHGGPRIRVPRGAARYLERHAARLAARADFDAGPPWTLFRTRAALGPHGVVWPDLARTPRAAVLELAAPGAVPLNTCYVALAPDRETALAVAAVVNSSWAAAAALVRADEARGGYRRLNARAMACLPVPPAGPERRAVAQLSARLHECDEQTEASHAQLDRAIADALALPGWVCDALGALVHDHGRHAARG